MARFCFNCGTEINPEWNVCANCGVKLGAEREDNNIPTPQGIPPQPYQQPQYGAPSYRPSQYYPQSDNTKGILSLILGIGAIACWCFIFIIPIVLGIVAVVLGASVVNQDENRIFAIIGIILGVIGIGLELLTWALILVYIS